MAVRVSTCAQACTHGSRREDGGKAPRPSMWRGGISLLGHPVEKPPGKAVAAWQPAWAALCLETVSPWLPQLAERAPRSVGRPRIQGATVMELVGQEGSLQAGA